VAWGIFENGQRIFEQLKRSEFKNEKVLTILRKLDELYFSEKNQKSSLTTALFLFVVLMDVKHLETENNSRQTLKINIQHCKIHF